ncbi:protein BIG GRAIN 1-like E [Ipomoea triloba]|uniref:protein BIG GRAIN 1-like E n=1 Tax=Ipomoea triloba TaxID=35885 RepID=UPI00125DA0BE|nr:protein BIG GRAIN 1-like E [Ipomoea triloba]
MSKKSLHWRNDSGELDVFEAAKYFADANEISSFAHRTHYEPWRGGRKSLDMAISFRKSSLILPPEMEKPQASNNNNIKKHKQPSSPGGRLASFLNSLFNQTKKKSKSKSGKDDEDESPGGVRRRRRSSISHFYSIRSSTTNAPSNPTMPPSNKGNSGFRTPPPCAYTPTKSYKDFAVFSDQQVINGLKNHKVIEPHGEKPNGVSSQKYKLMSTKNNSNNGDSRYPAEETEKRKFNGEDDDADSDTSSDLFDLPNSELLMDFYSSSGLPVYETTKMDSIKRSAPISTAAI